MNLIIVSGQYSKNIGILRNWTIFQIREPNSQWPILNPYSNQVIDIQVSNYS